MNRSKSRKYIVIGILLASVIGTSIYYIQKNRQIDDNDTNLQAMTMGGDWAGTGTDMMGGDMMGGDMMGGDMMGGSF